MKVSIITSCFNREATIRGAMESVLAQDYPDIEYIVVDGASSDNSVEIIKSEVVKVKGEEFATDFYCIAWNLFYKFSLILAFCFIGKCNFIYTFLVIGLFLSCSDLSLHDFFIFLELLRRLLA